jgi:hypothetical protein
LVNVRDAIEGNSLDVFAETLAPNVVWIGLWPGELCRNRDDVLEMFTEIRERELRARPRVVAEHGDLLVVDPGLDGRHHVIVVKDGLVSEVRAYPNRQAALAVVEGRPL